MTSGMYVKEVEKNTHKILNQQQETIEYLKQREVKLLEQLKFTEKEIFKLGINVDDIQELNTMKDGKDGLKDKTSERKDFITPKKNVVVSNSGNITLNRDR